VSDKGTAIVSYIEPSPGYAREFNRWYEDDHWLNAVLAGPGILGGARFVATAECKALRPLGGTLFGDPSRGSYLGVAFLAPGMQAAWDEWVVRAMETIVAEGRLFAEREHIHTACYRVLDMHGAPPLDADARGTGGVIAIADEQHMKLGRGPDAPAAVSLALERTIMSSANPPEHELVLSFSRGSPLDVFRKSMLPASPRSFASPFLATIPGTDTYTEEL
jgi:hypothetical protein